MIRPAAPQGGADRCASIEWGSVNLDDLTRVLAASETGARGAVEITDLAYDADRVSAGTAFFCVPGSRADGHEFAPRAVAAGAAALVVERPLELDVPQLLVEDARGAMAIAADVFFGEPTRSLEVAGVTGTNGKTTTTFLLRSVLAAAGPLAGARRHRRVGRRWGRRARPRTRRPRRSTCSASSARCSTPATGASPSRRRPTAPRCTVSTASASTHSSSRTSRRIISICTGRWRTTTRRSAASSRARSRRLRR